MPTAYEQKYGLQTPLSDKPYSLMIQGKYAQKQLGAYSQPTTITQLVQDALNKRIQASGGMQPQITAAFEAASRMPDITKFPGYKELTPQDLLTIQRAQAAGTTGRVASLLNLQQALERGQERELTGLADMIKEIGEQYRERVGQIEAKKKSKTAKEKEKRDMAWDILKLQLQMPTGRTLQLPSELGGKTVTGLKAKTGVSVSIPSLFKEAAIYAGMTPPKQEEVRTWMQTKGSEGLYGGGTTIQLFPE